MKHWTQEDLNASRDFKKKSQGWVLPLLFTDVVILTIKDGALNVLLTLRGKAPQKSLWSLPGVMVRPDMDHSMRDAAMRAVLGKTNTTAPYLEQLSDFSGPDRDPRGWSSSYAYLCLMPLAAIHAQAGTGSDEAKLVPVDAAQTLPLAFDHNLILDAGLRRVRDKVNYSSLPAHLLAPKFTLTELMTAYEIILEQKLDKSSFRKKVQEAGFVSAISCEFKAGANRPAQLFEITPTNGLVLFRRNLTP